MRRLKMSKNEYKVHAGEIFTTPDHFVQMTAPVDLWVEEDTEQDEMTIFFSEDKSEEELHIHYMIQMLNDNPEAHEQHWDTKADRVQYDDDLDIHANVCMGNRLERDDREEKLLILQIISHFDLFGLNTPPYNVYNVQNKYGMLRFAVYNSYFDDYEIVQQWIDSMHMNPLSDEEEEKQLAVMNALGLTKKEQHALLDYIGFGYEKINHRLRQGIYSNNTEQVKLLRNALDKMPIYKGEVYRYSNLPEEILKKTILDVVQKRQLNENAFFSTTKKDNILEVVDNPNVKYIIYSKKGHDLRGINDDENEVLLKKQYFI